MRIIGRDHEIREIRALLQRHRLVTVTGAGGIGKTRLAQELAVPHANALPVRWVDLTSAAPNPTDDVLLAWSRAIEPVGHFGIAAAEQVLLALERLGPALVVVDNCEQVVDAAASFVEQALTRSPELVVLATSRVALDIPGEVTWHVGPLAVPPLDADIAVEGLHAHASTALFVSRADELQPGRRFDDATAVEIADLCRLLDGNPLAIRLAVARIRGLSIRSIREAIIDSLAPLDLQSGRGPKRQRSVMASIQWSYDLLEPETQRLLRLLAICPGGFTIECALRIAAGAASATSPASATNPQAGGHHLAVHIGLLRLVDYGLVEFDHNADEYRMLNLVRVFGLRRLDDHKETEEATAAHARYWIARFVGTSGSASGSSDLAPELLAGGADFAPALRWAMVHDGELACAVLAVTGSALLDIRQQEEVKRCVEWLAARNERHERGPSWAHAVASLAIATSVTGLLPVLELIPKAAVIANADGDDHVLRLLRGVSANIALQSGQFDLATDHVREADAAGDWWATIVVSTVAALSQALLGNHPEASALCAVTRRACANRRFPYQATASAIAEIELMRQRGELNAAGRSPGPERGSGRAVGLVHLVVIARVAVERMDPSLLATALDALGSPVGAFEAGFAQTIAWAEACLADDRAGAADVLSSPASYAPHGPVLLDTEINRAQTLFAAERIPEATSVWESIGPLADLIQASTPIADAQALLLDAGFARLEGDPPRAESLACEALRIAVSHGFALVQVDAIEAVAAAAAQRRNLLVAGRLIGACEAQRERLGYRSRRLGINDEPPLVEAIIASESAVREGASLTFGDAIALALRTRGARSRPLIGQGSLTPTELLVAKRAAEGATNVEIGRDLLISAHTVKTHLTRVYEKLAVANRTQLARQLRD